MMLFTFKAIEEYVSNKIFFYFNLTISKHCIYDIHIEHLIEFSCKKDHKWRESESFEKRLVVKRKDGVIDF